MSDSVKDSILAKFQLLSKEKEASSREPSAPPNTNNDRKEVLGKRPFRNKGMNRGPTTGLLEKDVGITEYVSPSVGFSGIIKHRFSDFQVHEIDKDRNEVVLDSMEIPATSTEEENPGTEYRSVLSEEQWTELEKIIASEGNECLKIDVTEKSKEERTVIHKAVKRAYGAKVCSNSVKEENQTFIQIGRISKKNRDRLTWPSDQGRFLHFTVFKENLDTSYLVNLVSKQLRTKANTVTFAGTKDKRAKTTQRMCVKNKRAESVKNIKCNKAHFGNYSYRHSPLRLGDLFGNRFTIAIRDVKKSDDEINESLNRVKSLGFINYFGLQRFGSSVAMPTHYVGKLMLLEDWKGAVDAILTPKENIQPEIQKACETWEKTRNPSLALKCLGQRLEGSLEGRILCALKKQPNNFYDALFALPRNSLMLYLHAYQSYIWNKVVSRRIREFGLKTLPGDLTIVNDAEEPPENGANPANGNENDGTKDADDSDDDDDDGEKDDVQGAKRDVRIERVKKLSEELASTTDLSQVVLPLPGNDIEFPGNCIEKWYFEAMDEDGITMDHFTNSKKVFALYGKYRKILSNAYDMTWKVVKYDDPDADLILSDWDKLQCRSLPSVEDENAARYKAVIMNFTLDPSTYATMLLREVSKCETSSSYQAKLTQSSHQNYTKEEEPAEKIKKIESESV